MWVSILSGEDQINNDMFPVVKLLHFLFKPIGYKKRVKHRLTLDKEFLRYFKGGALLWRIECKRLSHLELPKKYSSDTTFDNSYSVFVHTNDQDKYDFETTLSQKKLEIIKLEIDKVS